MVKIGPFFDAAAYGFERYETRIREKYPEVEKFRADKNSLEITSCETSKGKALAFLADRLGLEPSEICAFGDNSNDVEMLRYAGLGVAMGNACDAAKAAADYVTDDITADGLAKALAHFGLI